MCTHFMSLDGIILMDDWPGQIYIKVAREELKVINAPITVLFNFCTSQGVV